MGASLKLRLPEQLRVKIKAAAQVHGVSMNAEMIGRLESSFRDQGPLDSVVLSYINQRWPTANTVKRKIEYS